MKRKVGRPATGLVHDIPITFRWDDDGLKIIAKQMKVHKIRSQAEYHRMLVMRDAGL